MNQIKVGLFKDDDENTNHPDSPRELEEPSVEYVDLLQPTKPLQ